MKKNITAALLVIAALGGLYYGLAQKQRADELAASLLEKEKINSRLEIMLEEQRIIAEKNMIHDALVEDLSSKTPGKKK